MALDYEEEIKEFDSTDKNNMPFELPDGTEIIIKAQRIKCPEVLF